MDTAIFGTTKQIYDRLEDALSKTVFENRLLWNLTGDYKFIDNIIKTFPEFDSHNRDAINDHFLQQNREIIAYGRGGVFTSFSLICDKVKLAAVCDGDENKREMLKERYNVISPEELKIRFPESYVVITTLSDKYNSEIYENLVRMGFQREQILVFKDFLKSRGSELFPPYFVPGIVKPVAQDEVFIDAGCFNGNDCVEFKKWCGGSYKKIIAFEPNPAQYQKCKDILKDFGNLEIYPYGLWNENTELRFYEWGPGSRISKNQEEETTTIKTVKLDGILNGEKATFIKMDIEGAELNALKGAEQTILKHRPKLAVCVYHKLEDIWEIPSYILSLHNDYKIYFRQHSVRQTETVFYAV
ncbi:MAG: FkbM family methyltransferase [Oscillospiraceae bacterium]|nr:FkbM family methyltransferase [Oscillospiraceae bacterium]